MNATQEQLEFIRRHGITRCPPAPAFRVFWGTRRFVKGQPPEATEADLLVSGLAAFDYRFPPQATRWHRQRTHG